MNKLMTLAAVAASVALPMVANADGEPEIVVASGETYSVTDASVYRFRHYRFKIDNCMGTRNGVQISEFRLLNGDVDVTPLRSGFSYGEGMDSSTTQGPTLAVDGDVTTKWYTGNGSSSSDMSKCWIQLDFADPQPITAYDWATADDRWLGQNNNDKRDPMIFRLLGSDDGETWTELDSRNIGAKAITRRSWTGPYYALRSIGRVRIEGGVFEAQADIALSGVALHSGTMKIPTNRTVRIVSSESVSGVVGSLVVHGTLELQGTVFAHSLSGGGTVKGLSSGGDYVVLCAESGNNSAYNGRLAWMGGAGLLKAGDGEIQYTGYALCDAPLVVESGVLKLADTTPCFRHWRFKIDDCMGGMRGGLQISEFRLLNGDVDVTSLRSGFSYGEGIDEAAAYTLGPLQAVDGDLTTKWYTANGSTYSDMSKCWLQLDFADPQPVTAYAWATANDRGYVANSNDNRDPAKFCLMGSDGGDTWEKIGWCDIGSKSIARNTWTGPYAVGAHYGATTLRGGVLEVRKDVEFASVAQCGGNVRIAEGCAMTLANGGVWVGPKFTSDSRGAVNSSSSSANYMHVAATEFTGDLNMKSGTLTFKKGVSDRIFRLELKRVYSASANCVQLSRLMIYDESRNNLALGLVEAAAGTPPSELAPGTCAYGAEYLQGGTSSVTNLFDGKTGTKMCLAGLTKGQEFSRVIYFRLPASATTAACSYQFTTADDNTPARNPSLWTLESSEDGVTWNTVDTRTSGEFTNPTKTYTDFNGGTPMLFRSVSGTVSFASGACVSVASGATLNFGDVQCEISGLRIDCATGIGTMSNFSPAESGVLLLENVPAGTRLRSYTIPFSPGTTSNVGNLRNWGVYVNGAKVNYRAQLTEGTIKFVSCGFMLIVK